MRVTELNQLIKQTESVLRAEGLLPLASKTCRFIGMQFLGQRFYQLPVINCIRGHASRGRSLIDIGAARGVVTAAVYQFFRGCLVVEPSPEKAALLRACLPPFGSMVVAQCALAGQPGRGNLYQSRTNPDDAGLFPREDLVLGAEVEITTLDDLVHKTSTPQPYLIKIDVQGAELDVFLGAGKTLERTETIITEFWPYGIKSTGHEPEEYLEFLSIHGFSIHDLRGRHIPKARLNWLCRIGGNDRYVSTDLLLEKTVRSETGVQESNSMVEGNWK